MKKLATAAWTCSSTLPLQNLDWSGLPGNATPERGVLHHVGGPQGPVSITVLQMIFGQYTFAASMIGPPSEIEEIFRFAALHDIREQPSEIVPMDQANGAMAKVRSNKARYRMVLTT